MKNLQSSLLLRLAPAVGMKVDVSDGASVERMIIETVYRFGGLDILVSNAGVLKAGTLEEMTQRTSSL